MKRTFVLFATLFLFVASFSQTNNPAPYCVSEYSSSSAYPQLSKVDLSTLSNSSGHTPSPGYTFYNNVAPVTLNGGSSYTLKLTFNNVDAETMIKAWIDYNTDNVFTTNELVMNIPQGSVNGGMNVNQQVNFTVPSNVSTVQTRLRVSLGWHYANWSTTTFLLDSCHTMAPSDGSSGETEDYLVNLVGSTSVEESGFALGAEIFPNPTNGELMVIFPREIDTPRLFLYDLQGKEVLRPTDLKFTLGGLEKGIYLLYIVTEKGTGMFKVVKE